MDETVKKLLARNKGILAADESLPSIEKRFAKINLPSTPENRLVYRDMLMSAPGMSEFISGVILFDETINQATSSGVPFAKYLTDQGVVPGIKVDTGAKPLPNFPDEKITEGLDGLAERFAKYYELGARFSKWRAVINISKDMPTDWAIEANAHALVRFAALSQEANIVPIVEPEVLMDGDHTMEMCESATIKVHTMLFEKLKSARVKNEYLILKTNMIVPGKDASEKVDARQIGEATMRALKKGVPTNVPGIVFLSGGLDDVSATAYLNETNKANDTAWRLSFSYGRALQNAALTTWGGKQENVTHAQEAFLKRAKLNALATEGKYEGEL